MRRILMIMAVAVMGLAGACCFAQSSSEDEVYTAASTMPSFPGGADALQKWVAEHTVFPESALKEGITEGRVITQFVVTKTGKIGEVRIVRGSFPDFDAEAVRVVKLLPDFNPGKLDDWKPVDVWYTLPITFKAPK